MLANYLKVGFRNILKHKVYSAINLFGLAIGIAASLLITLYIADELTYDRFLKDSDRIFRVGSTGKFQGDEFKDAVSSPPIAAALLQHVPEVEDAVRFGWWRMTAVCHDAKTFVEKGSLVADANFFTFFDFPLIAGDPKTVLRGTDKVVITESTALRYFGTTDALGKILLRGENKVATEVTGIAKDVPSRSHLRFDMVFSGESWPFMQVDHWSNTGLYTYLKTHMAADGPVVSEKLRALTEKNIGPELQAIIGLSPAEFRAKGNHFGFFLQPLLDIHLRSALGSELSPNGNMPSLVIFGAVAVFILFIACINFMNLSTARATTRAREVGVRKSIGAARWTLIGQFLSESMIYSVASTLLALIIIDVAIKPFNTLAGKQLDFAWFTHPLIMAAMVIAALLIGLLAGSYPALYLTAFKPMDILKGKINTSGRRSSLRNGLVIFQFIISTVLILGSMVVYKQLRYMHNKDMGFQKENVVVVNNLWSLGHNAEAFRHALSLQPGIVNTSFSSSLPPDITDSNLFRKGGSEQDIVLYLSTVDPEHLSTLGYTLTAGRFFSRDFPSDSSAIVLNETAYKQLGFDRLDGQTVINFNARRPVPFNLIGVVKDFNFESLRNPVKPMAMIMGVKDNVYAVREARNKIAIRIAPKNTQQTIDRLETTWKKYSSSAFEFSFIDQNIEATFHAERRMSGIIFIFSTLAIIIACLGLFGLASYLSEQRSKEMSIRKVLGASLKEIATLLAKDFALLIAVAFVIATPLGWYLASTWLNEFTYRTTIDGWMMLSAGCFSFLAALFTMSYHCLKLARQNPLNNLKSE